MNSHFIKSLGGILALEALAMASASLRSDHPQDHSYRRDEAHRNAAHGERLKAEAEAKRLRRQAKRKRTPTHD